MWFIVPFVVICDPRNKIPQKGDQTPAEGMDFNHSFDEFDVLILILHDIFNIPQFLVDSACRHL